jgi:uncharacterized damage-inducible protein DinB
VAFDLHETRALLARTPAMLDAWLRDLPEAWTHADEGPDTWSAHDIVGHLIHGERTDWLPRVQTILEHGKSRPFEPFDRFAQFDDGAGDALPRRLDTFAQLRTQGLATLDALGIGPEQLERRGVHPEFGEVTLAQLLATWGAHDLSHVAQIARVMARSQADAAGPWTAYLPILKR